MNKRVGYRFMPSDEEIVSHFLKHKMDGKDSLVNEDVPEIDLCKHEPWELPSLCGGEDSHDQTWYFFCRRERTKRPSRRTKLGFWKSTGRDRKVKSKFGKEIGAKKSLGFHSGHVSSGKCEWTIHEYSPSDFLPNQTSFVLCKLMKKNPARADAPQTSRSLLIEQEQLLESVFDSDFRDSFHQTDMPLLGRTDEEILSFIHENLDKSDVSINSGFPGESDGFRPSRTFIENELSLADSFPTIPDECDISKILDNEYREDIYNNFLLEEIPSVMMATVARSDEHQSRQFVTLSGGGLPSSKRVEDTEYRINVLNRVSRESSSGSTSHGEEVYVYRRPSSESTEINASGQELSESPSIGSTTPTQEISAGYSNSSNEKQSARRSQFQHRPSKKLATKVQKSATSYLSEKQSSGDSGKMRRLLLESKNDQKMIVAEESSTLRTFMSSFIRFETLPTSHTRNPPALYMVNVLVGLVLFAVVSREMLIFH